MNSYAAELLKAYRRKGVLVDTNILLLYFVGAVNPDRIARFKRTNSFNADDYTLLCDVLLAFRDRIVTTPNVLTEVNSLINQLGEPERSQCLAIFSRLLAQFDERYVQSKATSRNEAFTRFGLTDCSIFETAQGQYLVLTDDLKLAAYLQRQGVDTVNFNNLRVYGWS
ncbi:MAG: PIN domain-containing protein [Elainellaceae cyanobacterium]